MKIDPAKHPEKYYGWRQSQLSIARFYGHFNVNGVKYQIDYDDKSEQPLVRHDVLKKIKRERRASLQSSEQPLK